MDGKTGQRLWRANAIGGDNFAVAPDGNIIVYGHTALGKINLKVETSCGPKRVGSLIAIGTGASIASDRAIYVSKTGVNVIEDFSDSGALLWTKPRYANGPSIAADGTLFYETNKTMFAIASDDSSKSLSRVTP